MTKAYIWRGTSDSGEESHVAFSTNNFTPKLSSEKQRIIVNVKAHFFKFLFRFLKIVMLYVSYQIISIVGD